MKIEWETRRPHELTSEYLGRVLEDYLGLRGMAVRARRGHFDDYFCPPEVDDGMNMQRLVYELNDKALLISPGSPQFRRIAEVREAVIQGEFDGTKEESDRWAASKEGQEIMAEFPEEVRKKLFGV